MHIHWWWHRGAETRKRLEDAKEEAVRSQQLRDDDKLVTRQVRDISSHNMFAEMLRQALIGGYQPPRSRTQKGGTSHG